jgi:hypothetical protein
MIGHTKDAMAAAYSLDVLAPDRGFRWHDCCLRPRAEAGWRDGNRVSLQVGRKPLRQDQQIHRVSMLNRVTL